ncbi:MAG: hypothetical protein UY74_C0006G0001 [Candidatus Kaiserbacteria bacterium GW2011_GWC2_52_8b]|uniref:Uncharacterized protein n=2 Tax=Candidatus Kaiseribacteriota TaxID=1752734 RepID=A0A0G1ZU14_9BACT|nr:MAG: hypothetical protein UY67_C0034G0001 [Candidatus Kaiserbacteria bacterium GW2011_GWA2_52_12]KKW31802.1 MAG: hypothetical protein UY74_C0006G0001 [Candidatus Kaiserbacteria bacterium GW2011_GWC2_52_8b]
MEMPAILSGESLTRLIQGAIGGAIVLAVVGFAWGGWSTASGVKQAVNKAETDATIGALAPVCATTWRTVATPEQWKEFKDMSSEWQRGDFVTKVVKIPGHTSYNYQVARACAALLAK